MQFHCIKMRYSNKPKDGIYVKGYGCFSFAKNMGTNATKVVTNVTNKYGQKRLHSAKNLTTDAITTA